jgi:hypothetical protein
MKIASISIAMLAALSVAIWTSDASAQKAPPGRQRLRSVERKYKRNIRPPKKNLRR